MVTHFFVEKDNILEKRLAVLTQANSFFDSEGVFDVKEDIIRFYANSFL